MFVAAMVGIFIFPRRNGTKALLGGAGNGALSDTRRPAWITGAAGVGVAPTRRRESARRVAAAMAIASVLVGSFVVAVVVAATLLLAAPFIIAAVVTTGAVPGSALACVETGSLPPPALGRRVIPAIAIAIAATPTDA